MSLETIREHTILKYFRKHWLSCKSSKSIQVCIMQFVAKRKNVAYGYGDFARVWLPLSHFVCAQVTDRTWWSAITHDLNSWLQQKRRNWSKMAQSSIKTLHSRAHTHTHHWWQWSKGLFCVVPKTSKLKLTVNKGKSPQANVCRGQCKI